jgi:hypothetical protein
VRLIQTISSSYRRLEKGGEKRVFDLYKELAAFHNQYVRLGYDEKKKLAGYRDANLKRLNSGLDKLGEENDKEYAHPIRTCNQGSYAMHTLNQHPENAYDIDVATIFHKADLPDNSRNGRKHIEAAVQKGGGNFKRPPEARTNAVTVWYAEGYHVDLAIYREYEDEYGATIVEHAGPDWTARDPMEITNWFNPLVRELSPSGDFGADVEAGQMRRIVRLVKAFAKSRDGWDLPGGLIISVLVAECYLPDWHRDDVSLYQTMVAIHNRLSSNLTVPNPVDRSQELTEQTKDKDRVKELRDRLGDAIERLNVLFKYECTFGDAVNAWHWVFQHGFWTDLIEETGIKDSRERLKEALVLGELEIRAGVAREEGGTVARQHASGGGIQRGWWLQFSVAKTSVTPPYRVRWTVKNYGPDAEEADDLGPRIDSDGSSEVQWEHTKYLGSHTMTCELHRDGIILARAQHIVTVR